MTRARDIDSRKTRIAAAWIEKAGWTTSLIERRHYGDIALRENDPTIVTSISKSRPCTGGRAKCQVKPPGGGSAADGMA